MPGSSSRIRWTKGFPFTSKTLDAMDNTTPANTPKTVNIKIGMIQDVMP
jgi:hypothetical protein